jgi:hypothetical protein
VPHRDFQGNHSVNSALITFMNFGGYFIPKDILATIFEYLSLFEKLKFASNKLTRKLTHLLATSVKNHSFVHNELGLAQLINWLNVEDIMDTVIAKSWGGLYGSKIHHSKMKESPEG